MVFSNAEDETLRAWRKQEASQCLPDSNRSQGTGRASSAVGYQSLRASRANWEGSNSGNQSGGSPPGGILDRLIESTRNQLVLLDVQRDETADYLQQLEALREQLKEKTEE